MNSGIVLAVIAMFANSGYDISLQQNAVRIKGDREKFLFVLSTATFLFGLILSLIRNIDLLRDVNVFYGFICGIVSFGGYYAYFISLYGSNRSVYTIFIRLSFILSIIFSFLFLGDSMTVFKIAAIVMCCTAMLLLSFSQNSAKPETGTEGNPVKKGRLDKYLLVAIVSCLFLATLNAVNKYAANDNIDTFAVLFWRYVTFSFILFIIIAFKHFKNKKAGIVIPALPAKSKKRFLLFGVLGGAMIFVSIFTMVEAMKFNDLSIILPISQLSFVVTMFFNRMYYKEKMSMLKYAGAAVAFIAIVLVCFK